MENDVKLQIREPFKKLTHLGNAFLFGEHTRNQLLFPLVKMVNKHRTVPIQAEVIKLSFMLNSAEHEMFPAHTC